MPPPLKGTTTRQFLAPDASAFVGVFLAALREEEGKEAFEEEDARQLLKVDVAFISCATTLTATQRERERERGAILSQEEGEGGKLSLFSSSLCLREKFRSQRAKRREKREERKEKSRPCFFWFELGCFF